MQRCVCRGWGSKAASAAEKISWWSGGRCKAPIYVMVSNTVVVVVGGRGYYYLNFPFSIRLKILAKKYFCGNICPGGGGGLEPPLDPPPSTMAVCRTFFSAFMLLIMTGLLMYVFLQYHSKLFKLHTYIFQEKGCYNPP